MNFFLKMDMSRNEACQSIFGYMFLWQVYGNVICSNKDLMAMVKSMALIVLSMKFCTMLRPTIIYTSVQALALPALALAILTHHPRAVFRHFASAEVQGSISSAIPKAPVTPRTWVLCNNPLIKEMGELVSEHRDVCKSGRQWG